MSLKSDVETRAGVPVPSGTQQSLFLDSVANQWWSKKSDGSSYPIGSTDTYWYDVTKYGLVADDATDNLAAWNTLYASLPLFATVYFPPGTYRFSGERTMARDIRLRILGAGPGRSLIRDTSATAHGFNQTVAGFYVEYYDLGFVAPTVTKTAGSAIRFAGNNAACRVVRCEFTGQFNGFEAVGTTAFNLSSIFDCNFQSPAANGSQIILNGTNINVVISDTTANCVGVASQCLTINSVGALQVTACDLIGGTNSILVNSTGNVGDTKITNCYLDQASGSTLKFMGTGGISRFKFLDGGITVGANGQSAIEIASTGTGTSIPTGIDFEQLDIYNGIGATGTTNGFLISGCRDFKIANCRIAGFTNAINVTPYNAAGVTAPNIMGNVIGSTENFAVNTNGIVLNAGAVAYDTITITDNVFKGNTTDIVDNSTYGAGTANTTQRRYASNSGGKLVVPMPTNVTATAIPLTTITNVDSHGGLLFPLGTAPGQAGRITVFATNAATVQTLTATLRYGAANTNADAAILTQAYTAGTAALGSGKFVVEWELASSTTIVATLYFINGNNAATGIAAQASPFQLLTSMTTPATIATAANNWLGLYFSSATAAAITIRSVKYETL